jgi:hypothetical protein
MKSSRAPGLADNLLTDSVSGYKRDVVSQSLSSSRKIRGRGTNSRTVVDSSDNSLFLSVPFALDRVIIPQLFGPF